MFKCIVCLSINGKEGGQMPIQANGVIGLDGHFSFLINALECIYCHMSHMLEISQLGEVNSSVLS